MLILIFFNLRRVKFEIVGCKRLVLFIILLNLLLFLFISSKKSAEIMFVINSCIYGYFLRDKNFNAVGAALSKKAKLISSQLEERHSDQSMEKMKQFVAKLPHMMATKKSLAVRTYFLLFFICTIVLVRIMIFSFLFHFRYNNS